MGTSNSKIFMLSVTDLEETTGYKTRNAIFDRQLSCIQDVIVNVAPGTAPKEFAQPARSIKDLADYASNVKAGDIVVLYALCEMSPTKSKDDIQLKMQDTILLSKLVGMINPEATLVLLLDTSLSVLKENKKKKLEPIVMTTIEKLQRNRATIMTQGFVVESGPGKSTVHAENDDSSSSSSDDDEDEDDSATFNGSIPRMAECLAAAYWDCIAQGKTVSIESIKIATNDYLKMAWEAQANATTRFFFSLHELIVAGHAEDLPFLQVPDSKLQTLRKRSSPRFTHADKEASSSSRSPSTAVPSTARTEGGSSVTTDKFHSTASVAASTVSTQGKLSAEAKPYVPPTAQYSEATSVLPPPGMTPLKQATPTSYYPMGQPPGGISSTAPGWSTGGRQPTEFPPYVTYPGVQSQPPHATQPQPYAQPKPMSGSATTEYGPKPQSKKAMLEIADIGQLGPNGKKMCVICETEVFGDENWQAHIRGDRHKKRVTSLREAKVETSGPTGVIVPVGPHSTPEVTNGRRICKLCNTDLGDKSWGTHVAQAQHRAKVDEELAKNPLSLVHAQFLCRVCNVIISGEKNQTLHTEGARHQRRLHLNRKVCVECSEEFYTPEDFRSHQIEIHQRTEQQLLGELDLGPDSQDSHASEKMMEHVRRAWQEAASDVDGTSLSSIF